MKCRDARRVRLAKITVAAAAAVLAGLTQLPAGSAAAASAPSGWAQTDYNATGSRANAAETTLTPAHVSVMTQRNSIPLSYLCQGNQSFPPLLKGPRVYAGGTETVGAYRADTGTAAWTTSVPDASGGRAYFPVAVSHGLVFVVGKECYTEDPLDVVEVYRNRDGAHLRSLAMPYGDSFVGLSVAGDYVVLVSGTPEAGGAGTTVYRVSDGSLVWGPVFGDHPATTSHVVAKRVFVAATAADGTRTLTALALATGAPLWSRTSTDNVQRGGEDAAGGYHLYTKDAAGTNDINPKTGAIRFTLTDATSVLAVDRDRVYALCIPIRSLCAYDILTGSKLWTVSVDPYTSSANEAAGVLYLNSGAALEAATGNTIRTLPHSPVGYTPAPVVGNGRVAAVSDGWSAVLVYALPGS